MTTTSPQSRPAPQRQSWLTQGLLTVPLMCDRLLAKAGRWPLFWLVIALLTLSMPLVVTSVAVWQQGAIAAFLMALGWLVVRLEQNQSQRRASEYLHLFLAWLSIVTTLRYLYYRTNYTLNLDTAVNGFFSLVLYAAELYAIVTLLLSYFQTLKLRDRTPIDLATIPMAQWPAVDVYIPTYNEDVEIVRKTALAAVALDYPDAKKQVYILDDGRKYPKRREELRRLCQELGCILLTRDNNDHAKAGNINTAMRRTKGELILILDCDHIPTKRLLQNAVGFFTNPKVALVQTPHWFYNPDPFERNLLTQGRVPVNNELFYKVIQKGNDFWNAAFFCGSAAIIRKDAVMEIGGIAVETVTEDCHTSLRLHSLGYESVYYDKIMVAGLAPEKFSSYVGQQVRWARGMAQILRRENPLFNRKLKLSLPQRICYLSATSHFFFGFPRIMYAIAPVLYLLFGINLIRGLGIETLAYALPHIALAMNANYITQKTVRFSFWNEIFEYAMAFQDGIVTFMALINPKLGKFNVTDKGASVTKRSFDWDSARASLMLLALLLTSLVAVPFWLYLRPDAVEAVVINALWCVFNLVLIVAALLVAMEQPQMRRAHRLNRSLQSIIYSSNQENLTGRTLDVSETGARILMDSWPNLPDVIEMELVGDYGARAFLDARILRVEPLDDRQVMVAVEFVNLTPSQYDGLVLVLYSDVDEWYSQHRTIADRPLASLRFFLTSLLRVFQEFQPASSTLVRKRIQAKTRLYWRGRFYGGMATEINSRVLRVELESPEIQDLSTLRQMKPPVGILITPGDEADRPVRLVAQVTSITTAHQVSGTDEVSQRLNKRSQRFSIDLVFPNHLDRRQGRKIRALLKEL